MNNLILIRATIVTLIVVSALSALSDGMTLSSQLGPSMDPNWYNAMLWLKDNTPKDAIIATWWDPGHWITAIAERGAHADGAHCESCKPYPLAMRIVDMGKVLTTGDEEQAVGILKKYMNLTPEQCSLVRKDYGDIVPCNSPSEMYFIASADLIGKYPWPSYFGSRWPRYLPGGEKQEQFFQVPLQPLQDNNGNVVAYYDQCLKQDGNKCSLFDFLLMEQNGKLVPIYQNRYIVKNVHYSDANGTKDYRVENATLDGTFWVDPSFRYAFFMLPDVANSMFTRLYFYNGEGLKHFELKYSNGEVKIFKVNF